MSPILEMVFLKKIIEQNLVNTFQKFDTFFKKINESLKRT